VEALTLAKNVSLLIDISKSLKDRASDVSITVLGAGKLLDESVKRCKRLGLDNIKFKGRVNRDEVDREFCKSDVILFTSLSEANTSALFEGIQRICIPVALDLDGFRTNVTQDIGFKISLFATV
jgi:glycosyltransferase involved in cell wall biosynthesis